MYRAKRKAPSILTEPFNKTNGAFRQEKSLCLILRLTDLPSLIAGATANGYTYFDGLLHLRKIIVSFYFS